MHACLSCTHVTQAYFRRPSLHAALRLCDSGAGAALIFDGCVRIELHVQCLLSCMRIGHAYYACTHNLHACITCMHNMHTKCACNVCVHDLYARVKCMHAKYAFMKKTLRAYKSCMHSMHACVQSGLESFPSTVR